jgi:hypothetical protein
MLTLFVCFLAALLLALFVASMITAKVDAGEI